MKISVPGRIFSPNIKLLCIAFHDLCLKVGMQAPTSSGLHCDGKDDVNVFNAVIPFGNFSGGNLLL
jgi:hypothetical protein